MAACSQCGHPNLSGKFCGSCGAPLSAQPQGPAPMQPPVGPPAYPQPPGQTGAPLAYPQAQYPGHTPAPRRSSGLLKVLGIIGGVLVLGFVALLVIALLLDDEIPTDEPGRQDQAQVQPADPASAPVVPGQPDTSGNPLGVQWAEKPVPGLKLLAQGKIDEPFAKVAPFGQGVVLARGDQSTTEAFFMDYAGGKFVPARSVLARMGGALQLMTGDLYNDGSPVVLVVNNQGVMIADDNEHFQMIEESDLSYMLVGDWDGDGLDELAVFHKGQAQGSNRVYTGATGWLNLGQFPASTLPRNPVMTQLTMNDRRLLMSDMPGAQAGEIQLAFYTLDPTKGFEAEGLYRVPQMQPVSSFGAAMLGGKPVIVTAHVGKPSYLALYDIGQGKAEHMGTVNLPDSGEYQVLLGAVSGTGNAEIMAIDRTGKWVLYGF